MNVVYASTLIRNTRSQHVLEKIGKSEDLIFKYYEINKKEYSMSQIKLIKPTMEFAEEIMEYRQEFLDSGDNLAGSSNLGAFSSIEEWINEIRKLENVDTCPIDKVSSTLYMGVRLSDNKVIGMINFRHHINHPILSVWGGHIGYSVRPSERRKGYAKEMLRQVLNYCKEFRVNKVLITCDSDNIASRKTIIANGGIFENEVMVDGKRIQRYWIQVKEI